MSPGVPGKEAGEDTSNIPWFLGGRTISGYQPLAYAHVQRANTDASCA